MIPRYQPALDLSAFYHWFKANPETVSYDKGNFLSRLGISNTRANVYIFKKARYALYAYFQNLSHVISAGTILVSVQICPIVPLIVQSFGFTVRFVDIDNSYPSPSAQQYLQALEPDTVGIIISPLYGYIQEEWQELLNAIDKTDTRLILDLAQGLGLEEHIELLIFRADAIVYSFGIGKGLDVGGGLLCTDLFIKPTVYSSGGVLYYLGVFLKSTMLRVSLIIGLYPFLIKHLHAAIEEEKLPKRNISISKVLAPTSIYSLWNSRLNYFYGKLSLTRQRSQELGNLPSIKQACRYHSIYFSDQAIHLRQIIRFNDASLRNKVLHALRNAGIDCLPAGESLPSVYFPMVESVRFPNSDHFCESAIRLPFLARLSDTQFHRLKQTLEDSIAQQLHQ